MLLLPPLALTSGCATHALWTKSALDNWNEPAAEPGLHLYASGSSPDFLAVYDEFSDRRETTSTRAYYLYLNRQLLSQKRAPHFADIQLASGLSPVPVFHSPLPFGANQPLPFAVCSTNDASSFTLYDTKGGSGSYHLPVYNDGSGACKRVALTPLAVAADTTILGGIVGVWVWQMAAGGDGPLWIP